MVLLTIRGRCFQFGRVVKFLETDNYRVGRWTDGHFVPSKMDKVGMIKAWKNFSGNWVYSSRVSYISQAANTLKISPDSMPLEVHMKLNELTEKRL